MTMWQRMISLQSSRDVILNKTKGSQSVFLGPTRSAFLGHETHSVQTARDEKKNLILF